MPNMKDGRGVLRSWRWLVVMAMAHAGSAAASPYIYSTLYTAGKIEVRDVNTRRLHDVFDVGGNPFAATLNKARTRLHVLDAARQSLLVVDTLTDAAIATVALGGRPTELMVPNDDSHVFVGIESGAVAARDVVLMIDTHRGSIDHSFAAAA